MIALADYGRCVLQAYGDTRDFLGKIAGPVPAPLPHPFITDSTILWYLHFAMMFTGTTHLPCESIPSNYGSWLMVDPGPRIAVNFRQLGRWEKRAKQSPSRQPLDVCLQTARCVLHEVGHLKLHKHLHQPPSSGNLAHPANEKDEGEAWVYAMTVLAILLGEYACCMRQHGQDDTCAIPV